MRPQKFPDIPFSLEENTEGPGTTSSETLLPLDRDRRFDSPDLSGRRSRPSWRDQEGRRVSDEVVLGTSVFSSSENGMSGNFWGRIKGSK